MKCISGFVKTHNRIHYVIEGLIFRMKYNEVAHGKLAERLIKGIKGIIA
jgi:hypothetical protein